MKVRLLFLLLNVAFMQHEKFFSTADDSIVYKGQLIRDVLWDYKGHGSVIGMSNWPQKFSTCGGKSQSPINIEFSKVVKNRKLELKFGNYYTPLVRPWIENIGHTVAVSSQDFKKHWITGNVVNNATYYFHDFHFHWGVNSAVGSEHKINGRGTVLELHLVHYNSKYATIEDSVNKTDGLVVLGVLYKTVSTQ
ncbi:GPI-linked carbonic anhydrase-like isoform 1 [Leptotrombidium deliense]|uniref:carbonic anhydrase n=1 Tax=Leptotrombidium deliense TaxID=299467 RepID=A0A443SBR8_9ACAR|nr:GPI-linked carbonic anhydrase-like isoform 1 [Leptotrombidium deliense]